MDSITSLNEEARKAGKSYGQLQAERYEQQLRLGLIKQRFANPEYEDEEDERPERPNGGRYPKPKPEGWEEIADLYLAKIVTQVEAAEMLNVSPVTLRKWVREAKSNSNSC